MHTIEAGVPLEQPPSWAVLQRHLFALMEDALQPFLDKYTHPDGRLIWRDGPHNSRDGADDFYESFHNWPELYLLGGGDRCLELGDRQWDATTRLLEEMQMVDKEYEIGYDQFHQSESYIYFYLLCMADPANQKQVARARRFAGFYLNEDPEAINYGTDKRIILAPHNGSRGPRPREGGSSYSPGASMVRYGLPYEDVEGVSKVEDLGDPELARRMGAAMDERMSRGDVAANLGVVSLVTNAWLLTGEEKYSDWVLEYVGAWLERSEANGGLPPDNVGLSGEVGEYIDGKWYGGLYGWTWPHGFYNIGMACVVASSCAYLISGEERYLDLARIPIDRIVELGEERDPRHEAMSLKQSAAARDAEGERRAFLVPHRYTDSGWFDYMPMMMRLPLALWNLTGADEDRQRVEHIRELEGTDWRSYTPLHGKEDTGHERPWHAFLRGANPDYPETALRGATEMVYRRIQGIREDDSNVLENHIHQWQQHNPVTNETLIQLTLGAPQLVYNGGLMIAPLRYYDADRRRPGLPEDVSALVHAVDRDRIDVELVNLNAWTPRHAIIQAGSFGQHTFTAVECGDDQTSAADTRQSVPAIVAGDVAVRLPPGSTTRVRLALERGARRPSYRPPWET